MFEYFLFWFGFGSMAIFWPPVVHCEIIQSSYSTRDAHFTFRILIWHHQCWKVIRYLLPLTLPGSIYTVANKINYTWCKSIEGCAAIWGLVVETSIFFSGPLVKLTNWIWLQHFIAGAPLHQGGDNSQSTIQLSNYVNLWKKASAVCWLIQQGKQKESLTPVGVFWASPSD